MYIEISNDANYESYHNNTVYTQIFIEHAIKMTKKYKWVKFRTIEMGLSVTFFKLTNRNNTFLLKDF